MKRLVIILLFKVIGVSVFSQIESPCSKEKNATALWSVEWFLTWDGPDEEARIKVGATQEKVEDIALVDDPQACAALLNYMRDKPSLAYYLTYTSERRAVYYYQTENFYYIFTSFKEGYMGTGPRRPFHVIKKDFSQRWEFLF